MASYVLARGTCRPQKARAVQANGRFVLVPWAPVNGPPTPAMEGRRMVDHAELEENE